MFGGCGVGSSDLSMIELRCREAVKPESELEIYERIEGVFVSRCERPRRGFREVRKQIEAVVSKLASVVILF